MAHRAAVLCYHSTNVETNDYAGNDHVALADDLDALLRAGVRLVSPMAVARHVVERRPFDAPTVAITFDDGCIMDALPFQHPSCGPQPGFLAVLQAARPHLPDDFRAASFVIASPSARAELDRKEYLGLDVWHDDWWPMAQASGLIDIENHSWDHNHPCLDRPAMRGAGRFDGPMDAAEAEAEVEQASRYIAQRSGRAPRLFAYPWGQVNPYLHDHHFPAQQTAPDGLVAAFGTGPAPVDPLTASRWAIPRFVCGWAWRSPADLADLVSTL